MERAGLPTVQICTITSIAMALGANRILPATAIPYPVGNPDLSIEQEKAHRKRLVRQGLKALQTNIEAQTIF